MLITPLPPGLGVAKDDFCSITSEDQAAQQENSMILGATCKAEMVNVSTKYGQKQAEFFLIRAFYSLFYQHSLSCTKSQSSAALYFVMLLRDLTRTALVRGPF